MSELKLTAPMIHYPTRWIWYMILGATLLGLGTAAIGVANMLQLSSLLVFGPMLLASSIMQILVAFFSEKTSESLRHFLAAAPEAVLGYFIMAHSETGIASLVTWVALLLAVAGLVRLAHAAATHSTGQRWLALAGVIALLLALGVWLAPPQAALWLVGCCIAGDFLCHGATWSGIAWMERKAALNELP
jgi:uncharacterized membrane protein HdeD (DUF308 family)